ETRALGAPASASRRAASISLPGGSARPVAESRATTSWPSRRSAAEMPLPVVRDTLRSAEVPPMRTTTFIRTSFFVPHPWMSRAPSSLIGHVDQNYGQSGETLSLAQRSQALRVLGFDRDPPLRHSQSLRQVLAHGFHVGRHV